MWTVTHKRKDGCYVNEAAREIGVSILSMHGYSGRFKKCFFLGISNSACLWTFSQRESLLVFHKPIVDRLSLRFDSSVKWKKKEVLNRLRRWITRLFLENLSVTVCIRPFVMPMYHPRGPLYIFIFLFFQEKINWKRL